MPKVVIAECTSTTKSEVKDNQGNLYPGAAETSAKNRWWSPAVKKLRKKSYTCELYVEMRRRLNKINRRSSSLLPQAKVSLEDEDPGGVVTESFVKKFSMIRSIFDITSERNRNYYEMDNKKASFNEIDAWIKQLDTPGAS